MEAKAGEKCPSDRRVRRFGCDWPRLFCRFHRCFRAYRAIWTRSVAGKRQAESADFGL